MAGGSTRTKRLTGPNMRPTAIIPWIPILPKVSIYPGGAESPDGIPRAMGKIPIERRNNPPTLSSYRILGIWPIRRSSVMLVTIGLTLLNPTGERMGSGLPGSMGIDQRSRRLGKGRI